jgi:hypothetical protein
LAWVVVFFAYGDLGTAHIDIKRKHPNIMHHRSGVDQKILLRQQSNSQNKIGAALPNLKA